MPEIETVIVGTKFKGNLALEAIGRMRPGQEVRLERDSGNRYDRNAVACHFLGLHVGFIPKLANPPIARAMDAGIRPVATVTASADVRGSFVKAEPKILVEWGE